MKCRLVSVISILILTFGLSCTAPTSETAAERPSPKVKARIAAMLEDARQELQRAEEAMAAMEKQIRDGQAKRGFPPSPRLLAEREQLREKVLRSKVSVRELEILLGEEK